MSRLAALAPVVLAACLAAPQSNIKSECTSDAECNTGAGEVCDEGVCWGDPPTGLFAAVLGPPTTSQGVAATTEVGRLALEANGWFGDARTGVLTLASSVRVSGRVRAPCPTQLASCIGFLNLGAQVRWSRASSLPGGERVTVPIAATAEGFELFLPKPEAAVTYQVTITPSLEPLGPGLPAPAQFFAPQRFMVTINPADAERGVARDFQLGSTATRTIAGRIARPVGPLAGWRIHAEAADGEVLGAFMLASNVALTATNGDFALTIPDGATVVDVVVEPPAPANRNEHDPPSVRVRDHVTTANLATIEIPAIDRLVSVPIAVRSTNGNGDPIDVAAATVRVRLDQELTPPGTYLRYETTTTTNPNGSTSVPLYLGLDELPLRYQLDLLPGPSAELSSVYGIAVVVDDTVPTPQPIVLPRRIAMVGTLRDDRGFALADTSVSASVSGASLCKLSSDWLRAAKALAPAQDTTNARGEFKLWVDRELAGSPLDYDLAVEPSVGTWAPRWTFVNQKVDENRLDLWMPSAAHVRARVVAAGQLPLPDTVVSIYQLTQQAPACMQAAGGTYPGGLELRAIGSSDDEGIVRVILPRVAQP